MTQKSFIGELPDDLRKFILRNEFREVAEERSASFNDAFLVLYSGCVRLRVLRDRGILYIDIGPRSNINEWYDVSLVKALLENSSLVEATDERELMAFLNRSFMQLRGLFNERNFKATQQKLKRLERARAKKMFPNVLDIGERD
jgi:hypothetical protein